MALGIAIVGFTAVIFFMAARILSQLNPVVGEELQGHEQRRLFDAPLGPGEVQRTCDVLSKALAASTDDAEFEASFRQLLSTHPPYQVRNSWLLMVQTLDGYRSGVTDSRCVCAERYLKTLSRELQR